MQPYFFVFWVALKLSPLASIMFFVLIRVWFSFGEEENWVVCAA